MNQSSLYYAKHQDETSDSVWGIAYVVMDQGVRSQYIEWHKLNIMLVLGTLGGQVVAIIGISRFILKNYQKFSYYKAALLQLYNYEP